MSSLRRSLPPRRDGAPTRRAVAARLVVAGLLAVSLAACGSGDDERRTTTTVDGDAWVADLAVDCESLNDEFARLADADPSDRSEAVRYAEDVDAFAEAMVAVLDDAATRAPDDADGAEALADLVELTAELEAATTELADAANAGDAAAVDAAAAEVTRLGQRINPVADDLGVGDCGGF